MFKIFTHANLFHEFIFVTIHPCQLTNMSKDILNTISKLKKYQDLN